MTTKQQTITVEQDRESKALGLRLLSESFSTRRPSLASWMEKRAEELAQENKK